MNLTNYQIKKQIVALRETVKNRELKQNFFNLGPNNNWKELLNKEMQEKVKKLFKNEMEEIGYI